MVKMVSLKMTKADRKEREDAMGEAVGSDHDDAIEMHIPHHHLTKMLKGRDGRPLPEGNEIEFHGRGHVTASHEEGDNSHMRVRLTHAGIEHDPVDGEQESDLRNEIETVHGKQREEGEAKERAKIAKRGEDDKA